MENPGDWYDEISEFVQIQQLVFSVTSEMVPDVSSELDRSFFVAELNASFVVETIVLAVRCRPLLTVPLADLFAALTLRSSYDLKVMLMSHFTEIPFSAHDPLLEWSHLRFFRILVEREVLSASKIVGAIRSFYDNGPEFLVRNIVFLCFFARAIQATDGELDRSLFADFAAAREDVKRPLHAALSEVFEVLSDPILDDWASVGWRPGSLGWIVKTDDVDSLSVLEDFKGIRRCRRVLQGTEGSRVHGRREAGARR
jgi:hypothetical protein